MSDVPISPDIRAYVPLAPYKQTAVQVALTALQDMASKLPGVTLREGMTEVLLVETLASMLADLGIAVDRIPAVVFEVLIRLFDVDRDAGAAAAADLEFTLIDSAGHTIPAGTEVAVDVSDTIVVFATDVDLVVAPASSAGIVAATATTIGDTPNGLTAGTEVRLRTSNQFVQDVVLDTDIAGGRDPETDDAYFTRAAQVLRRLTEVLVLPDHFTAMALEDANVFRALTIDLYDGTGGSPGSDTGHVTVAVRGLSGDLSGGQKTALEAELEDAAVANLLVHVIDATVTSVAVTADIGVKSGYVEATVISDVEAMLEAYLTPDSWPWDATVRRTELISLIDQVSGVDYVDVLTAPAADVNLTGDAPLATAGVLTITAV